MATDQFLGEIRIFPGTFAPEGWAFCNGQLLPLAQNTALFSLLGTVYGGDGQTTFALPDLQGRATMHPGQGPGLSARSLGEVGGSETVTLAIAEIPSHAHTLVGDGNDGNSTDPQTGYVASGNQVFAAAASLGSMQSQSLSIAGGGAAHNNMQPYLTLNFIIALTGEYPAHPETREHPALE